MAFSTGEGIRPNPFVLVDTGHTTAQNIDTIVRVVLTRNDGRVFLQ